MCSALLLNAQEKTLQTTPTKAMVYLRSAKVTEEASVNLTKGKNIIKLVGLPNSIDENSYQVALSAGATLLSVSPSTNYLKSDEYSAKEQELIDNRAVLQTQIKLLQAEIGTLTGELQLIEQNQKIGNNDNGWTADELSKLATYYSKRTLEIRKGVVKKSIDLEGLNLDLKKINQQINASVKDKNVNRNEVVLEIESSNALRSTIRLTYITTAAGWQPFYDIRVQNTTDDLDFITKAKVYQNTGKAWGDIDLSVSTYLPRSNQNRPILNPFYVREAQQAIAYSGQARGEMLKINAYQLEEESMALDEVAVAEVLSQQFNILYKVNGKQDVDTKGNGQTFILDRQKVGAKYVHHSVPKLSEDVFLLANIQNWQSLNLLVTEANIYFQDTYIGKTTINPNYTKSEFPISLGVDERIVVKRRLLDNLESTKFLSSKKIDNYAYEISIRNNSGAAITLEILDQIPIAQNNKIEVIEVQTAGGNLNESTGSILWTEDIARGSGKILNLSYKVKYPKDMKLQFF